MDVKNIELTYVFVDEYGNEYDLFEKWHGAATDWSFLFEDDGSETDSSDVQAQDDWTKSNTTTNIKTEQTTIYTGKKEETTKSDEKIETNKTSENTEKTEKSEKIEDSDKWTNSDVSSSRTQKAKWKIVSRTPQFIEDTVPEDTETMEWMADMELIQQKLSEDSRDRASQLHIPYELLDQDPELVELIVNSQSIPTNLDKDARLAGISSMTSWQVDELRTTLMTERDKLIILERKYWTASWNILWNKDYVWETKENTPHTYKNCVTPWNVVVQHGDYVLAYQQRTDVPDICNVQKRVCRDGVLNGTYTQWYCNEDVEYTYTKVQVKEYNQQSSSPLIQNPKYWKYDGAEYDKYGKKNGSWNTPTTIWDNEIKSWAIKETKTVPLHETTHLNCTAPRWDIVIHGQFVKAYASPLGFTDDGCKVELRLCMDGELQWSYAYSKCKYTNMSYSDYIDGDKTIYELYNEAYNISKDTTTTESKNNYAGLDDIYWEVESLRTHNMEDSTDENTQTWYIKKSYARQIRDWLVDEF